MPLVTVRPGPILMLWRDGVLVAEVPLEACAALSLASDLLRHAGRALPDPRSAR